MAATRGRKPKITWDKIRKDFKEVYPRLSKETVWYGPYGYLQILIVLKDGTKIVYDYMTKQARIDDDATPWGGPKAWKKSSE